jgi:hypothetical protein
MKVNSSREDVMPATRPHRPQGPARTRSIIYWLTTTYLAVVMLFGGFAEILDATTNIEFSSIGIATVVAVLGYPFYFVYILGVAKILGAVVIISPAFPRLKEWAYAGLTFNMIGALLSWFIVTIVQGVPIPDGYGTPIFHVLNAGHLVIVIIISWLSRPNSRRLGSFSYQPLDSPIT